MHEFGIVLMKNLSVNESRIFGLLSEAGFENVELRGEEGSEKKGSKDGDAGASIQCCGGKKEPIDSNVPRAEETEHLQTHRKRVPDRHLPYVFVGVRMGAGCGGVVAG